ncbi:MAG TPA: malate synthase A [Candidatus Limnocylindrales bacterium]|nr:malate synthase A [Candidatus Limnocylindrales bacterium]
MSTYDLSMLTARPAPAMPDGVEIESVPAAAADVILTNEALGFLRDLERTFRERRAQILRARSERQAGIDAGRERLGLRDDTGSVRVDPEWRVAESPPDLLDRRVEITGPAEAKMMINALNSGAKVFMADFEDALSPTWENVVSGQAAVRAAVRGTLAYDSPEGKAYRLKADGSVATLLVRPRGWHLPESHVQVDGEPMSASLFDAGLYLFHNAAERLARGTGPYVYLPKLQSHLEARLWNDVFVWAQSALGIPNGSVRATVLIETLPAAFEMEEILYELRDHASGLNAGRRDYLFSCIKTFRTPAAATASGLPGGSAPVFPDRSQVTMTVPFMRAYTDRLVLTCHRRGAHAIGGMAAYIPSRRDPEVNERALAKVLEDKDRESGDGFDGTWVAHPDLVPVAREAFDAVLGERPNQRDARVADAALGSEIRQDPAKLLDFTVPGGRITVDGVRLDVSVGLRYLNSWLMGTGAAAINDLMEDAATAEISRSQLWQWRTREVALDDGSTFDAARYQKIHDEELWPIADGCTDQDRSRLRDAAELLDRLVLEDDFTEFLTVPAYPLLD